MRSAEIPTGLSVDGILRRALELRERLRAKATPTESFPLDIDSVEILHALGAVLDQADTADPKQLLDDVSAAFEFISALDWPRAAFGGREDILSRLAFLGWRYARQSESPAAEFRWRGAHSSIDGSSVHGNAERILAMPEAQRTELLDEWNLEDPEQLLSFCTLVWSLGEIEPARARDEATFFYRFLKGPTRSTGIFNERDYYIGEFALIAGGACRILSKRDEARRWFDLAEVSFVLAHNASCHISRVAYQRLALRLEERDLNSVVDLAPRWFECLMRLDLREEALKCRFLEAHALKETGRWNEAGDVFRQIKDVARAQRLDRLCAMASENLFHVHSFLGEVEEAMSEAREAAIVLRALNNRVNLAKLQAGVGYLLREQGRLQEAIAEFREAQRQFSVIEMTADVAATHLVLADLLLDAGQVAQAEGEVRAALPVIDQLKLVPEGIAALSLLRASARRRQIDRQALRSLSGYFEDLGS